jgi:predicted MFS family arabinose efflux permease
MGVILRSLLIVVFVFIAGFSFVQYGSDFLWSLSTLSYLSIGASLIVIGVGLTLLSRRMYKGENTTVEIFCIAVAISGLFLLIAPIEKALVNNCFDAGGVGLHLNARILSCIDSNGKRVDH